ncbi:MAG: hypothetical protein ACSHWZ_14505 [Sulfitobacter sp.]
MTYSHLEQYVVFGGPHAVQAPVEERCQIEQMAASGPAPSNLMFFRQNMSQAAQGGTTERASIVTSKQLEQCGKKIGALRRLSLLKLLSRAQ